MIKHVNEIRALNPATGCTVIEVSNSLRHFEWVAEALFAYCCNIKRLLLVCLIKSPDFFPCSF